MSGPRHAAPDPDDPIEAPAAYQPTGYQPVTAASQLAGAGYQPPRPAAASLNEPLVPRGAPTTFAPRPIPSGLPVPGAQPAPPAAPYGPPLAGGQPYYGPPPTAAPVYYGAPQGYYPPAGAPEWMTNPSAPPPNRRRLTIVLASVVAVAVIAVGGTLGARHFTGTTSHSTGAATGAATDAALARVVVQASDLPAGWTSAVASSDPSDNEDDSSDLAASSACTASARDTSADIVGSADSPEFSSGKSLVDSTASSYKTEADVQSDAALLADPKLASCMTSALRTQLASALLADGVTLVGVTVTPALGPQGGPVNVVGTLSIATTGTKDGATIAIYDTQVYIIGPQVEVEIDFVSGDAPFPAALQQAVVAKVAARAAKA